MNTLNRFLAVATTLLALSVPAWCQSYVPLTEPQRATGPQAPAGPSGPTEPALAATIYLPGGGTPQQSLSSKLSEQPSLLDFGGKGDETTLSGVSFALNSHTLRCAGCSLTSSMIGKTVVVDGTVNTLRGFTSTVTLVPNSATLILADPNSGRSAVAIANGTARVGTDNSAAINSALATISGWTSNACLRIPSGNYLFTDTIHMQSYASVCADPLATIDINNNSHPDYNGIEWIVQYPDCPNCKGAAVPPLSAMHQTQPATAGSTTLTCLTYGCCVRFHAGYCWPANLDC